MNCKICFENYNSNHQPVTLMPCGHSICLPCLQSLEYAHSFAVCPHCRCEIFCSKPNYDLIEVLEHQNQISLNSSSSMHASDRSVRRASFKEIIEKDLELVNERLKEQMKTVRTRNPELNNAISAFKNVYNRIKYN